MKPAEAADRVYAVAPGDFVVTRNRLAAAVDEPLRTRVRAFRKPTLGAWAVNLLVRHEPEQVEQALELGRALREAAGAMRGDELRALGRQRRQLATALAASAQRVARRLGVRLSDPAAARVAEVLNAAMLESAAAELVRTGWLLRPFNAAELPGLDVADLVAVPEALGHRAAPAPAEEPVRLRAVPDDAGVRRARAADRVERARTGLEQARGRRTELAGEMSELTARTLQVAEEIDELRRRLTDLETDADELEEAREELAARETEADAEVDAAAEALTEAERQLATIPAADA